MLSVVPFWQDWSAHSCAKIIGAPGSNAAAGEHHGVAPPLACHGAPRTQHDAPFLRPVQAALSAISTRRRCALSCSRCSSAAATSRTSSTRSRANTTRWRPHCRRILAGGLTLARAVGRVRQVLRGAAQGEHADRDRARWHHAPQPVLRGVHQVLCAQDLRRGRVRRAGRAASDRSTKLPDGPPPPLALGRWQKSRSLLKTTPPPQQRRQRSARKAAAALAKTDPPLFWENVDSSWSRFVPVLRRAHRRAAHGRVCLCAGRV